VLECAKATNEGRDDDAAGLMLEMLRLASEQAEANPSPSIVWQTMAHECEERGNWEGAEEAYRNAVAASRQEANPACAVKPLLDLAGLYRMLGRKEEALAQVEEARILADQSGIPSLVLMVLEAKLTLPLDSHGLTAIRESAKECFNNTMPERIGDPSRARSLLVQALCAERLGELGGPERLISVANSLMEGIAGNNFMTGLHSYHAGVAELMARIRAGQGEIETAIQALNEAVSRRRTIDEQPHVHGPRTRFRLAEALFRLADCLEKGGRAAQAGSTRAEADAIVESLKLLPSATGAHLAQ
jgi:tetratricopeptide (TPR) repeat protein